LREKRFRMMQRMMMKIIILCGICLTVTAWMNNKVTNNKVGFDSNGLKSKLTRFGASLTAALALSTVG
jgi:K+-transporting ATPase A subunit